jgi:hypothetical protein
LECQRDERLENKKNLFQIDVALKENWFCCYKLYMCTGSLYGSTCYLIRREKEFISESNGNRMRLKLVEEKRMC